MTDKSNFELVQDCGREMAMDYLKAAAGSAQTEEQMSNQLAATYWCAINILAHHEMNMQMQKNTSVQLQIRRDLDTEIKLLMKSDDEGEYVGPNGKSPEPA